MSDVCIAESKLLEVSLRQSFCKCNTGIDKYGSDVLKTVVNVAWSNPFSVYCNNYVQITGMYYDDLIVCYNMIISNWCNCISRELRSNVSVLRDMMMMIMIMMMMIMMMMMMIIIMIMITNFCESIKHS